MTAKSMFRLVSTALVALHCAAASSAFAAWSHDPQVVGLQITSSTQSETMASRCAIPDGAGGSIIAFIAAGTTVKVQHLGPTGAPVAGWPALGVSLTTSPQQCADARPVLGKNGNILIFWRDRRSGTHYEIYGQKIDATGAPQWTASGVLLHGVDTIDRGEVWACPDTSGGAFVCYRNDISVGQTDLYAAHVTSAGTFSTLTVSTLSGQQLNASIAADGVGGAYVCYQDHFVLGNAGIEIKLAHIDPNTFFNFANYEVDHQTVGDDTAPQMIVDSGHGVYIAWIGLTSTATPRLMLTHYDLQLNRPAGFAASGNAIYSITNTTPLFQSLCLDNSGGVYVAFSAGPNTRVAHVTATGALASGSPANGLIASNYAMSGAMSVLADGSGGVLGVSTASTSPLQLTSITVGPTGALGPLMSTVGRTISTRVLTGQEIVTDTNGGAFVFWTDSPFAGISKITVAHIDRYGILGDASPVSAGVRDIPADQGGAVRLTWNASWMDGDPEWGISSYRIYRHAPLAIANEAVRSGAGVWAEPLSDREFATLLQARSEGDAPTRVFQHDAANASLYAWELIAIQSTNGSARYSYVASTTTDSTAGHNPYTAFMVEARSALDSSVLFQSLPDSGYSVDNVPPVVPAPFTATRESGVTNLHWDRNADADLAGYRLYRGTSPGFETGPATLISETQDSGYTDVTSATYVYKLTAVDVHGNESPVAIAQPTGTLAVDDAAPHALAFALASGNPARGGATLRFALPSASRVRIALYDAAGREVRVLADGAFEAGTFTRAWDGADASGAAAPSGLYFARLTTEGREMSTRFVLTR